MFKQKLGDAEILMRLVDFAKERNIPHFQYKDFTFDLKSPDPNGDELARLRLEMEALRSTVSKLKNAQDWNKKAG